MANQKSSIEEGHISQQSTENGDKQTNNDLQNTLQKTNDSH